MSTKIEAYKNKYQHVEVKCPFCVYTAYVRPVTKISPDPLRDLKRHITNQAKSEALDYFVTTLPDETKLPHLKYYKFHTSLQPDIPKVVKRKFDDDLVLENNIKL